MTRHVIFGVFVPALLVAACGDATGPGGDDTTITELPRSLTVTEQEIITRGNAFGLALMAEMAGRDDRPNVILSPLSASMALGMTMNGAAGSTFDGMRATLGFDGLSQEQINEAYSGLIELLTTLDPEVRFDIANSVWVDQDIAFHQAFLDAVRAAFDATVESRDFGDPATLQAINGWVSENTDGLIDRILDTLDPELAAILINAIYFEGAWTYQFDPSATRRQDFHREDGTTVEVDMMNLDEVELPLSFGAEYAAAELPYGGEAYSMVVVLPHGGVTARRLLQELDADGWQAILDGLAPREVDLLAIPKFTLAWDGFLNDALRAMGMEEAFLPGADFTRMAPDGDRFCIDFVRQKTYIEIDERGTKAAAVTAVGIRPTSFNGLIADRPFVFAIRERLTGTLVFVGLVGDPTLEDSGPDDLVSTCR